MKKNFLIIAVLLLDWNFGCLQRNIIFKQYCSRQQTAEQQISQLRPDHSIG